MGPCRGWGLMLDRVVVSGWGLMLDSDGERERIKVDVVVDR